LAFTLSAVRRERSSRWWPPYELGAVPVRAVVSLQTALVDLSAGYR
jgi:hypothetical protein